MHTPADLKGSRPLRSANREASDTVRPALTRRAGARLPGSPNGAAEILALLPRKVPALYFHKHEFYGPSHPPNAVFLVLEGRVLVSRFAEDGQETAIRVAGPTSLLGDTALIGARDTGEAAVALDSVRAVSWEVDEVEAQMQRYPQLAAALLRYFVSRNLQLQARVEAMALHQTADRVLLSLLQLGTNLGLPTTPGKVRMPGLPHHVLADLVGTTREITTSLLGAFRRRGLLDYTRKHIVIDVVAIRDYLRDRGLRVEGTEDPCHALGAT